jgi:hypothetical protein
VRSTAAARHGGGGAVQPRAFSPQGRARVERGVDQRGAGDGAPPDHEP